MGRLVWMWVMLGVYRWFSLVGTWRETVDTEGIDEKVVKNDVDVGADGMNV